MQGAWELTVAVAAGATSIKGSPLSAATAVLAKQATTAKTDFKLIFEGDVPIDQAGGFWSPVR